MLFDTTPQSTKYKHVVFIRSFTKYTCVAIPQFMKGAVRKLNQLECSGRPTTKKERQPAVRAKFTETGANTAVAANPKSDPQTSATNFCTMSRRSTLLSPSYNSVSS